MKHIYRQVGTKGNKRVVLIYPKLVPPFIKKEPYVPLSILAVASPLIDSDYKVTIIDSNIEDDYEDILQSIDSPICFGLSCMMGYQVSDAMIWTRLIRRRFSDTPIIWGGWFPTVVPSEVLTLPDITAVVRGQGEQSFLALVKAIEEGSDLSTLSGVYTRNGTRICGKDGDPVDPNNYSSMPYFLLQIDRYSLIRRGCINYTSSYGCPYNCQFCSIHLLNQRRVHMGLKPERVVYDLKDLKVRYGINYVEFFEDNFLYNKERAIGIFEGILKSDLKIDFTCNGGVNNIIKFEPEALRLLKKAGCKQLGIGVESGSEKVLKLIKKGIKKEQVVEVVKRLREYDISARLNFMVGLPGEEPEDFMETLNFLDMLRDIHKDILYVFFLYVPIPNTSLFYGDIKTGNLIKPASMNEWADYYKEENVGHPWFFKQNRKFFRWDKEIIKKMGFYYVISKSPKLDVVLNRWGLQWLKSILSKTAKMRVSRQNYSFPVEYLLGLAFFRFKIAVKRLRDKWVMQRP